MSLRLHRKKGLRAGMPKRQRATCRLEAPHPPKPERAKRTAREHRRTCAGRTERRRERPPRETAVCRTADRGPRGQHNTGLQRNEAARNERATEHRRPRTARAAAGRAEKNPTRNRRRRPGCRRDAAARAAPSQLRDTGENRNQHATHTGTPPGTSAAFNAPRAAPQAEPREDRP